MRVLFFGRVADLLGRERQVDLPEAGCTVAQLRRLLSEDVLMKPGVRASVDKQVVTDEALVRPGAEVAFFSVFSGG
jgi:molybdopterin converting factor small subunit